MCYAMISDKNLTAALITRIREADADELAVIVPMLIPGLQYAAYDEHGDWILDFEDKGMALFNAHQIDGLKLLSRVPDDVVI